MPRRYGYVSTTATGVAEALLYPLSSDAACRMTMHDSLSLEHKRKFSLILNASKQDRR